MKKIYFLLLFSVLSFMVKAQLSLTATAGTTGPTAYSTLKATFDAINAGTHRGTINITISGSTSEVAPDTLQASLTGPSNYDTIIIKATAAATISGSITGALIVFNGASKVTILGNNLLTITNPSTSGNTITFANDATKNIIQNTTIKGATSSATAGVITFGTAGTIASGNDNNKLVGCNVDGMSLALYCLYSSGTTTSPTTENSGDTLRNCNFFDNNQTTGSTYSVYLAAGNTDWTISGNSIYQTVARVSSVQGLFYGLVALPAYTNDFHTISGNFIGGSSPGANGTFSLSSTTVVLGFIGMDIETGGTGNTIQNNTIQNVSVNWASAAGSFSNAGAFMFIGGYNGVTTFTGNIITNLSYTNTAGSALGSGIRANGQITAVGTVNPTFNINNNNISAITYTAGGAGNVQFIGLRLETSSGNTLTNTSISNPLFTVIGNTLSNLTSTTAASNSFVRGIMNINTQGTSSTALLQAKVNITNNNISAISSASTLAAYTGPVAAGIFYVGSSANASDINVISQNTVSNINATNTGDMGITAAGIYFSLGAFNINKNKIYNITNAALGATTTPGITGLNVRNATSASSIFNNFITLGNAATTNTQIIGILNNFNAAGPINVYFNSVLVTGSGAVGNTKTTLAFLRGTETFGATILTPMDLKDNLLINNRSGGGSHYAIGNIYITTPTGFTSNYNDLYSTTPGTIALWGATAMDLPTYQATSGQDANSKSINPTFTNPATGDLHLAGASFSDNNLRGIPAGGITTDIDGQNRSGTAPFMGADEAAIALPITLTSFNASKNSSGNILNWSTNQELNTSKFIVERSGVEHNFSSIGEVGAAGNSTSARSYTLDDPSPLKGINYYRLRIVDRDNSFKFSDIKTVRNLGVVDFVVTPNPVSSIMNVTINSDNMDKGIIIITDANGRESLSKTVIVNQGANLYNLNLSNLASGVYIIKIQLSNDQIVKKFSKL